MSHGIPDDIKHFQQAEPEHYFDYTNWRLKICISDLATKILQLVGKRRRYFFLLISNPAKKLCKDVCLEQYCVLKFPICFTKIIQKCYVH